jgi:hypothetical protein
MLLVCARRRFTLDRKGLTSGDQNITVTHDLSHEPGPVTPPLRNWCGVVVKMALTFVLDVEREDMVREPLINGFECSRTWAMRLSKSDTLSGLVYQAVTSLSLAFP